MFLIILDVVGIIADVIIDFDIDVLFSYMASDTVRSEM